MKLRGLNLGEEEVDFKKLSNWPYYFGDKSISKKCLQWIEQKYAKAFKQSQNTPVKQMKAKEGKVIIKQGMINHMCSSDIDCLNSISKMRNIS